MRTCIIGLAFALLPLVGFSLDYNMQSKTLSNGLKIIVCEKKTNRMAEIQVWYRVGSKDEWDGVRGMAHLFEHMMFRGSKKFNGDNKPFKVIDRLGGEINAYTTFDRTVYHEEVPGDKIETVIDMEADRMANLVLDQKVLDTEREVVGEELRLSENNWYNKLQGEKHACLYPNQHPYKVDVIGYLNEITSFTTKQCQEFYDKYYSPNNAFVVITGNVNAADMFAYCEKYFGVITKQLPFNDKKAEPDIFSHKIEKEELTIDFPVQVYSYLIPSPAFGHKDYYAFNLFTELFFSNSNSILNKAIVNTNMAYQISSNMSIDRMYNNYSTFDIIMQAGVGNAKVKKEIVRQLNLLIQDGIEETDLKLYLANLQTKFAFAAYSNEELNGAIGFAEYYYRDYTRFNATMEEYSKISSETLQYIAKTYFNPEQLKVLNIKPKEIE